MANLLLFLLPAILGILIPPPAAAIDNNHLLSGQTLNTNDVLFENRHKLVMQDDCNLVLYNGWQSNTAGKGNQCSCTLNNNGQLIINDRDGNNVWASNPPSKEGRYAVVLHPDGKLVIYGPGIFEINPWKPGRNGRLMLGDTHTTSNMLFSGQFLYNNDQLNNRNYRFVMQDDCNVVLYGGSHGWQSNTHGNGEHCFFRLDHRGGIVVMDDDYHVIWKNNVRSKPGEYVLILQENGRAVVYGPAIWSTEKADLPHNLEKIAMVAGKK